MYKTTFKSILDFSLAFLGFVVLFPFFIVIFAILYFTNSGKPFFLQPRPGKNEEVFNIMKFKTMNDSKSTTGELLPDEKRLTRFGNFLRRTSLDEIPQLLNVIKGDMSLVGPRPLRVRYLPYYTERESIRHTVKPGITGLAQVSGRNSLNWDEKLSKDVEYVEKLSFWLDCIILLKTLKKVFIVSDSEIILDENMNALDEYRQIIQTDKYDKIPLKDNL
jgi:lipopolysaccharide/colanic/teichoic acid biosynthesis glycosyltransferase